MAMRLKSPMKKSKKKLDPTRVPNYNYNDGKKLDPTIRPDLRLNPIKPILTSGQQFIRDEENLNKPRPMKKTQIMTNKINEMKKRYM